VTAMRDMDDFLPLMRAHARGVPDPVAFRCLREAARDLCLRARLWRESDDMTLVAPECESLLSFTDAEIVEIEEARLGTRRLTPASVDQLDQRFGDWQKLGAGTAECVSEVFSNTLTVIPKQTGELRLRVILQPSIDAMTLPQFLLRGHGSQLGEGAAAIALMMPGTAFSLPELGAVLHTKFDMWVERAKYRAAKTINGVPLRAKPMYF
jgi:hypothetical protein